MLRIGRNRGLGPFATYCDIPQSEFGSLLSQPSQLRRVLVGLKDRGRPTRKWQTDRGHASRIQKYPEVRFCLLFAFLLQTRLRWLHVFKVVWHGVALCRRGPASFLLVDLLQGVKAA